MGDESVRLSLTTSRRALMRAGAFALAGAWVGPASAGTSGGAASSPAEEKARLKEQLQRELERRVYNVDEALFRKVNRARDPKRLTGHERSHVPLVRCPGRVRRMEAFRVEIVVGVDEVHEMSPFHYVDWIDLKVDDVPVNHAIVTPVFNRPVVAFDLILERTARLVAREHCNLHGLWESEPAIVEVAG
jgi:superoxide reductase